MEKTIKSELSKRLNDLGLLDNIETEYYLYKGSTFDKLELSSYKDNYINASDNEIKTLTVEEAIDFLPSFVNSVENGNSFYYFLVIIKQHKEYKIEYSSRNSSPIIEVNGDTLLESIEKMITYLLDNNLLTK